MNLDYYQKLAAHQSYPYSAIIAGAGTGKTFTLLGRIEYLINSLSLKPEEILVISFTNETVKNFENQCETVLGVKIKVLTFHKLAILLLNIKGIYFDLSDNNLLEYIIKEFIENYCESNSNLFKCLLKTQSYFTQFFYKHSNQWKFDLEKSLTQFIYLCSSKNINVEDIKKMYNKHIGQEKFFLLISFLILNLYNNEKESQNLFDFNDLIIKANNVVFQLTPSQFIFKHILVDEFQDASFARITFLKNIIKHFHIHFTVVGDDCQSIYRFSGTESNCFDKLDLYFPNIHYFFLKYTYRNSQELISMANHFIQKNPSQIKKEVISDIHLDKPVEVAFFKNNNSIFTFINSIVSLYDNQNILFLGRNSFDWKFYFSYNDLFWIDKKHFRFKKFPNNKFTYLTVHQSKGLEADIVILLHLINDIYGFPNKLKPNKFLKLIYPEDKIAYEEERRLFYVALTRTKGKIFLIAPINNPSTFVSEILKDYKKFIKIQYY